MADTVKRVFESKEEWEAEVRRRRAVREATNRKSATGETAVQAMTRKSRERGFEADIKRLKAEADSLRSGVLDNELAKWPAAPKFLENGIVQRLSPDDNCQELKYDLDDVIAWRGHVGHLKKLRDALRCGNCYAITPKPPLKKMARCGNCKVVRYCSRACQRADHARHKLACAATGPLR